MVSTSEAIENVRSLSRVFQSVIDLADALGNVANVEQAINETHARLSQARAELTHAQAERDAARAEAADLRSQAREKVKIAAADAEQRLADAEQRAAQLLADARSSIEAEQKAADEKLAAKNAELRDCMAQTAEATQALADLEARITRAKAKMAEMLGG